MIKFKVYKKDTKEEALIDVYMDEDGVFYEIEERTWAYQCHMHKEEIDKEKYDISIFMNGKEINDRI